MDVKKININQSESSYYITSDIYDVSARNNGATFKSLSALLRASNLSTFIPTSARCGGMSISFVQSSDNKYVQYRYTSSSTVVSDFTNVNNWQGVDDEPTAGSDNLVKSGGVFSAISAAETNNSSITFNVVDKIIDLPTSNFGIWKQKYLHVENRNNVNADAKLYCVYIDIPCKISASNLANMQDGYLTRCWAAYSEREINNEYLISEFSDPSYSPRRTGVSCNLDIPSTVKMVCFSSIIPQGNPVINVTTVVTNDEIIDEIDSIRSETDRKITKDYTYSGDTLDDITEACKYRLGISVPNGNPQAFLYYPRKGVSVSIRNITSDGNACSAIVCFKERIEITADTSSNYEEYLFEGWGTTAIPNTTRSYEDLIFPEEVKMVYIYCPDYRKLEIVEHVGVMEEIASVSEKMTSVSDEMAAVSDEMTSLSEEMTAVSEEIASVKSPYILSSIDDVPNEDYNFNEQPIIAKFFADRITHRDKYINTNSRKVYWSPNNGSDDNDGLTASTSVKSYSKVKSMLSNGSELYIERGSVITELCKFNYNGLLIDTYGSELLDNPIFDNFILTDSSEWEQV